MKKHTVIITAALLLLCACQKNEPVTPEITTFSSADMTMKASVPINLTETTIQETEETNQTDFSPAPEELQETTFPQTERAILSSDDPAIKLAENMTDEELIALANSDFTTETYITDYYPVNRKAAPVIISAEDDFDAYCQDISNYPSSHQDKAVDVVLEKVDENEYYSEWRNAYTEIREYYSNDNLVTSYLEREDCRIMLKNFIRIDSSIKYIGEMSEEEIKNNFDIKESHAYPQKLFRSVTMTEDGAEYEYLYFERVGGDWGIDDTAYLYLKKLHISSDGDITEVINNPVKECDIPGTAPTIEWDE